MRTTTAARSGVALGLALGLSSGLAACTGSTPDRGAVADTTTITADETSTPSTAAEVPLDGAGALGTAVRFFSDAALSGDGATAHRLLSQRCQDVVTPDEVVADVTSRVGGFSPIAAVTENITGDSATVDYSYSATAYAVSGETWVLQDGGWRRDAC